MGSALDHLEKLLAEQYRRELDQDENIWRSLPFIAATLALELTTLFQVVVHLGDVPSNTRFAALLLLSWVILFIVVAVLFAALMVPQDRYRYIAGSLDLLRFATSLDQAGDPEGTDTGAAMKAELARQYAAATERNRSINTLRNGSRRIAGLLSLLAVLLTVPLVVLVFWHNVIEMLNGVGHVPVHAP